MKKFVSLILALAMVFSLSVSASAEVPPADINEVNGTDTGTVSITVNANNTGIVYHVNVAWDGLDFTYNQNDNSGTWDPTQHKYTTGSSAAGWVDTGANDEVSGTTITRSNVITVTNHSNTNISVMATFENGTAQQTGTTNTGVTATLSFTTAQTLASADIGGSLNTPGNAPSVAYGLTVSGTPSATEDTFGVITVKIS